MQDILREPIELIDRDLDEVAGGNSFSGGRVAVNSGHFAIGAVFGDSSTASGIFAGEIISRRIIFIIQPSININLYRSA